MQAFAKCGISLSADISIVVTPVVGVENIDMGASKDHLRFVKQFFTVSPPNYDLRVS